MTTKEKNELQTLREKLKDAYHVLLVYMQKSIEERDEDALKFVSKELDEVIYKDLENKV